MCVLIIPPSRQLVFVISLLCESREKVKCIMTSVQTNYDSLKQKPVGQDRSFFFLITLQETKLATKWITWSWMTSVKLTQHVHLHDSTEQVLLSLFYHTEGSKARFASLCQKLTLSQFFLITQTAPEAQLLLKINHKQETFHFSCCRLLSIGMRWMLLFLKNSFPRLGNKYPDQIGILSISSSQNALARVTRILFCEYLTSQQKGKLKKKRSR